jgi:hypothetical protein
MKYSVLIFIIFFPIIYLGQEIFIPMVGSDVQWQERTFNVEGQTNDYYSYFTSGDTLFSEIAYYKLFHDDISQPLGFLRENEDGQVYFKTFQPNINLNACGVQTLDSSLLNQDLLLVDFNLEIGDTLFSPFYNTEEFIVSYIVVYNVETINTGGFSRKVVSFFDNLEAEGNFVEGVGSDFGLFRFWCTEGIGVTNHLDCYLNEQQPIYGSCVVDIQELAQVKINLYPNPTSGNTHINWDKAIQVESISIVNLSGSRVYHRDNLAKSSSAINIDVHDFSPGMYFVELITGEGERASKKLIIE